MHEYKPFTNWGNAKLALLTLAISAIPSWSVAALVMITG